MQIQLRKNKWIIREFQQKEFQNILKKDKNILNTKNTKKYKTFSFTDIRISFNASHTDIRKYCGRLVSFCVDCRVLRCGW